MIDCIWSGGNIQAVSEESETASCSNVSNFFIIQPDVIAEII